MVRIRFRRVGKRKQPYYRIVVADSRSPRDGRFIETIGHYNPRTDPPTIIVKEEKLHSWIKEGAQPTDSVKRVLISCGVLKKTEEDLKKEAQDLARNEARKEEAKKAEAKKS